MISHLILGLLSLPLIVSAHFHMLYPSPRSDEDDSEATFPCGGFALSKNRTQLSTVAFPLALEMGHDRSVIQVLLAVGNDPGDNFNIVLEPTFQQQGEGPFCLPTVRLPASLNLTAGTNGTIQVVTDGEGGGGLYVVSISLTLAATLLTKGPPYPVRRRNIRLCPFNHHAPLGLLQWHRRHRFPLGQPYQCK